MADIDLREQDENRILGAAAPAIIGLLKRRRESAIMRLIGEYRNGNNSLTNTIAEISTLEGMLADVRARLEDHNKGR